MKLTEAKLRVLRDVARNEGCSANKIFARSKNRNKYIVFWYKHLYQLYENGFVDRRPVFDKKGNVKWYVWFLTTKGKIALKGYNLLSIIYPDR